MAQETGHETESHVGRRVKVESVTKKYVPGGAEYWLTSADGSGVGPLTEGTVLEVVEEPSE
jgi:hypothetical protein